MPLPDIKRYKHLLLDRINWKEYPEDAVCLNPEKNECDLVWEGCVKERSFPRFESRPIATELDAREYLARFGLEHYWKLAKDYQNKCC